MDDVDYVRDASVSWLLGILEQLECETVGQLSPAKLKAPYKETLVSWIDEALHFVSDQNDLIKKLRDDSGMLKTQLIDSQQKVIELQGELLDSKTEQLTALQTTVADTMKAELASVQEAVETKIHSSWSEVAAKGLSQGFASAAKIKEAVKSAVAEDEKSKNFMIFGKEEAPNEDIVTTVAEILQDLNEKPRVIECTRVGTSEQQKLRPIKVRLTSSDAVFNVLRNAKLLKKSCNNKATFIGPDRSKEERAEHKKLVDKMRTKMGDEPDRYHFIRGGVIRSVKK